MQEVKATVGKCIDYIISGDSIIFGENDLMINLKNREMDTMAVIDICFDDNGFLVVGAATGYRYAAQIEIPPREYTEVVTTTDDAENAEPTTVNVPVPFDINKCKILLYGGANK